MFTKLLLTILIPQLSLIATISQAQVKGASIKQTPGWYKSNAYAIEPIISAPSAVVIDEETGGILFKKDADTIRPVASISKLIAAHLYLKKANHDLERKITMQTEDERNGGRRLIFRGEIGTAENFLHTALIGSDNSAMVSLIREAGFLENYKQDTEKLISQLQLKNTSFIEPTGLNSQNFSTALEIAQLTKYIFKETPQIPEITTKKQYYFSPTNAKRGRIITSTNDLLDNKLFTITGGKTGFTNDALYCLVMRAENREGKAIIIAILGAETEYDRFQDAKTLAWWIFENFE